jgi:ASC-1-like (ASCH) protein
MEHQMKLYQNPFKRIQSGNKRIELRLFDEKRRNLNIGDIITFSKLPELEEQISVKVTGLLIYRSFEELINDFPVSYFGYPEGYSKSSLIDSCYEVYSKEDEKKYGVLGIKIEKI